MGSSRDAGSDRRLEKKKLRGDERGWRSLIQDVRILTDWQHR